VGSSRSTIVDHRAGVLLHSVKRLARLSFIVYQRPPESNHYFPLRRIAKGDLRGPLAVPDADSRGVL
jgi:hypothetical protein